jgi:hypothetical protein
MLGWLTPGRRARMSRVERDMRAWKHGPHPLRVPGDRVFVLWQDYQPDPPTIQVYPATLVRQKGDIAGVPNWIIDIELPTGNTRRTYLESALFDRDFDRDTVQHAT